jgi:hypothetical protein
VKDCVSSIAGKERGRSSCSPALKSLPEGVYPSALVRVRRRRGRIESRRFRLWGRGERRVEVEHEQDQSKHDFSLRGQLAARAPLPVKRVPLRAGVSAPSGLRDKLALREKGQRQKDDTEVTREVA